MNVLIIKRDKLGDLLLTTPTVVAFNEIGIYPDLLAPVQLRIVADGVSGFGRKILYKQIRSFRQFGAAISALIALFRLSIVKYDLVIVAAGEYDERARRMARFARKRKVVLYGDSISTSVYQYIKQQAKYTHESERIFSLANSALGGRLHLTPKIKFKPPKSYMDEAKEALQGMELIDAVFVVIGVSARKEKKRFSASQIRKISEYLGTIDIKLLVFWTPSHGSSVSYPGDDEFINELNGLHQKNIYFFGGRLEAAIGILWYSKCNIFPDSGLMHFASSAPAGVIGLFVDDGVSPSKEQWKPLGAKSSILMSNVSAQEIAFRDIICELNKKIGR